MYHRTNQRSLYSSRPRFSIRVTEEMRTALHAQHDDTTHRSQRHSTPHTHDTCVYGIRRIRVQRGTFQCAKLHGDTREHPTPEEMQMANFVPRMRPDSAPSTGMGL